MQANVLMAVMLGEQFAAVAAHAFYHEKFRQMVNGYGLLSRIVPGNYNLGVGNKEVYPAIDNPGPLLEKFKTEAQKAIDAGASVIIPIPGGLGSLICRAGLFRIGAVPVLHIAAVAAKFGEMMADMRKAGVEPSRVFQVAAHPGKELLHETLDDYAKVFKIEH